MLLSLICHFLQKYVKNKQKEYTKIKREITMLQILVLCLALCMDEFVAVSYTHLDVYKRQLPTNTLKES